MCITVCLITEMYTSSSSSIFLYILIMHIYFICSVIYKV